MEINIYADTLYVKTSTTVKLSEHFTLITTNGVQDLLVDITADLAEIPTEYHEVFINMLTTKYLNKVSFTDNPFSKCTMPKKNKWWEVWKKKHTKK